MPINKMDLFLEHKGIKIYHCYDDGVYGDKLSFWYGTDPNCNFFDFRDGRYTGNEIRDKYRFDIRNLSNYHSDAKNGLEIFQGGSDLHKKIIKHAIDCGFIK